MIPDRLITLAIHTYEKALLVKNVIEREGIYVELNNVNLTAPEVSPGVRIRIKESDLPLALRIVENFDIFASHDSNGAAISKGTILVPTDFSDYSLRAAKLAMELAAWQKWNVHFLHAFMSSNNLNSVQLSSNYDYDTCDDIEASWRMEKEAKSKMAAFTDTIKKGIKTGDIPAALFTCDEREGLPEDIIIEYTREELPQMVVMGTRGADKKGAEMIGSVTAEVLDGCRVPAFTVPENVDIKLLHNLRHIAFFCNLDQEDILALDTIHRLFPDKPLDITLINIPPRRLRLSPPEDAKKNLLNYCSEHYSGYTFRIESVITNSVFEEVSAIAGETPFDMICLPNKHKNVFARVFNPSLAHKVLFRADIPMMVIPV